MDIYSLIGSGNPSCLSITGVCNEMAEQHREGWRERISLFDIFKISLSVCKWRILPVILVYFFNLRLIIVIPSKFIFFVIKNRRVSLLASPVVLWQRHWHLCCIRSPSGMIESTPLLFGDSWRVPSACTPLHISPLLDPCDTHQQSGNTTHPLGWPYGCKSVLPSSREREEGFYLRSLKYLEAWYSLISGFNPRWSTYSCWSLLSQPIVLVCDCLYISVEPGASALLSTTR